MKKLQTDTWSGERLTNIQATSRPEYSWPEIWSKYVESCSTERKLHFGQLKSEARQCGKIKDTEKNARKKLESSMDLAVPCKVQKLGHGETGGKDESNPPRAKYACMVEADESTKKAHWKNATKRSRRSPCGEGIQLVESLHSCAQVYSYAPSNENFRMRQPLVAKSGRSSKHCQHCK